MDFDPDSPLNRAHTRERQAEDHLKAERFDSAADCFHQSISNLNDVLSLTSNSKARQAIEAQIRRNESQILLTKKKKDLLVLKLRDQIRKQELVEQQQIKSAATRMSRIDVSDDCRDLGMRIVRVMDEHDSLLQVLIGKGDRETGDLAPAGGADRSSSSPSSSMTGSSASYRSASKVPKGDKTIIEELRISNEQLRVLVEQLVNELSALRSENERLSLQVADLLNEQSSNLPQLPPLEQPKIFY